MFEAGYAPLRPPLRPTATRSPVKKSTNRKKGTSCKGRSEQEQRFTGVRCSQGSDSASSA
jgi:hypothetical protein